MPFFIIVIGASAGGHDALCKLAATLPRHLHAAIFIVLHISSKGNDNFIVNQLQKYTSMHCELATEGLSIKPGHIYVASVDHHLILKAGAMHITKGPPENRWRPSIDVLFRSAAAYYTERVIGIVLTGLLDDGTAGMQAIKRCGGTCIVQEPREAAYPDMPQSVLNNAMVDFILPVAGMIEAIQYTIVNKTPVDAEVPDDIRAEAALLEKFNVKAD
ncbi:chemotaxis protein CheB [Niastella caeni]|uniref:protein-glutamate methylesterase n=1 Tax=Niastella caeni TaxID=2569763 RepID=A0A4S8H8P9_9BACT|nr:chemotaxis protein CheB [Niastella caeni]THU30369.1 chemotaxis protein CheB [Niastella caeni]